MTLHKEERAAYFIKNSYEFQIKLSCSSEYSELEILARPIGNDYWNNITNLNPVILFIKESLDWCNITKDEFNLDEENKVLRFPAPCSDYIPRVIYEDMVEVLDNFKKEYADILESWASVCDENEWEV